MSALWVDEDADRDGQSARDGLQKFRLDYSRPAFDIGERFDRYPDGRSQLRQVNVAVSADGLDGVLATLESLPNFFGQNHVVAAGDSSLAFGDKSQCHPILGSFIACLCEEGVIIPSGEDNQFLASFSNDDLRSAHESALSTVDFASVPNQKHRDSIAVLSEDHTIIAVTQPAPVAARKCLDIARPCCGVSGDLGFDLFPENSRELAKCTSRGFVIRDRLHQDNIAKTLMTTSPVGHTTGTSGAGLLQ
jgi:hypothetical protein